MDFKNIVDRAADFFNNGFSCSQSVFMAFAPEVGLEVGQAARIASPFGGGISRMGETCGAVTGALMALGAKLGHQVGGDDVAKERMYELARMLFASFKERNGTLLCRELLGIDIGDPVQNARAREEGLFKTRCPGFVCDAAEIIEDIIKMELAIRSNN